MDGEAHVQALSRLGGIDGPGTIVVHDGPLDVPAGHTRIDFAGTLEGSWSVYREDVADHAADWPAHDPFALARALEALLG